MADLNDVHRIALSLPETILDDDRIAFSVNNNGKRKGIAWVWMERIHPKKARVPNLNVIAIRVRDLAEKDMLLAAVDGDELEELILNAWRCQAPPALVRSFDQQRE